MCVCVFVFVFPINLTTIFDKVEALVRALATWTLFKAWFSVVKALVV